MARTCRAVGVWRTHRCEADAEGAEWQHEHADSEEEPQIDAAERAVLVPLGHLQLEAGDAQATPLLSRVSRERNSRTGGQLRAVRSGPRHRQDILQQAPPAARLLLQAGCRQDLAGTRGRFSSPPSAAAHAASQARARAGRRCAVREVSLILAALTRRRTRLKAHCSTAQLGAHPDALTAAPSGLSSAAMAATELDDCARCRRSCPAAREKLLASEGILNEIHMIYSPRPLCPSHEKPIWYYNGIPGPSWRTGR